MTIINLFVFEIFKQIIGTTLDIFKFVIIIM